MRLVCPNCDAEYEVDAALIPDAGRDVQCSNCGHAWFQASPLTEAEAEAEQELFAPAMAPTPDSGPDLEDDEEGGYDTPPPPPLTTTPANPATPPPVARNIDSSVMSVLREEAERESRARKAEGNSLQMQDELGLAGRAPGLAAAAGGASPATSPVADRIARMKGEAEIHATPDLAGGRGAPAKSEMLPEIDAINSTLRAKSERRTGEAAAVAETMGPDRAPGGFRRGFLLALILIILATALYVLAPVLTQKVPALADPLAAYVAAVDGLRATVDRLMQSLIARMTGLIGGA